MKTIHRSKYGVGSEKTHHQKRVRTRPSRRGWKQTTPLSHSGRGDTNECRHAVRTLAIMESVIFKAGDHQKRVRTHDLQVAALAVIVLRLRLMPASPTGPRGGLEGAQSSAKVPSQMKQQAPNLLNRQGD